MTSPSLSSDSKIEAGSPKLNEPVPDRSEYQRRCEEALRITRECLDWASQHEQVSAMWPIENAMQRVIAILDDGTQS